MNNLFANVINEMEKMFLKKKTVVLLVVTALIPIVTAISILILKSKVGVMGLSASNLPITLLGFFTTLFLPLFVFMWAADSFAGEAGEKTLKLILLRPISRTKIFTSKIISLGLITGSFLIIGLVVSLMAGMFIGGINVGLAGFINDFKAYILAVLPMLCLGIVAAFIAQFFQNSSGALTTSIFIYIAAKLLALLVPQAAKLLLVSYTDWHLLWLGHLPFTTLMVSFFFMLSYAIIFFSAGLYAFISKEV